MAGQLVLSGFVLLMALAAVSDARAYTIPNWIPAAVACLWPAAAVLLGLGWGETLAHLAAGFAVLALGVALWAPGWIGGGDAKLIAAAALWFGWPDALSFILLACAAGGALAAVLTGLRALVPVLRLSAERVAGTPLARGAPAPYAVAIAAGALAALPASAAGGLFFG